jgi:hypothetical protein
MLPNNKVNTRNNGKCIKKEHFATTGGQIQQIDETIFTMTSSSQSTQE